MRREHEEAERRALAAFETAPYRAVVEDMTELIVRWKPDGTRIFVNDAYCRLFDTPREKLLGTSFWPLITEDDRRQVRDRIARLSPAAPVSMGRHRAVRPNGEVFWMEWIDRALFDESWNVTEYQSVGRDMTERVRMEEQLRRIEHADAVARTSAAIAHDLANVLAVIAGEVHLAKAEYRGVMTTAVEKGVALLRQLRNLTYGRVTTPVAIDLGAHIEDGLAFLQEVTGGRARVATRLSTERCVVSGDPTQIDQILLNLVRNAAEAVGDDGLVTLETAPANVRDLTRPHEWSGRPPDRCSVLRVIDDGTGIDAAILPHIFEPNVSTKREGRGLGLATVKAIVDAHGGSIAVESTKSGTTFEIAFPRVGRA
jgi:PAS domain S-box-containing protein